MPAASRSRNVDLGAVVFKVCPRTKAFLLGPACFLLQTQLSLLRIPVMAVRATLEV